MRALSNWSWEGGMREGRGKNERGEGEPRRERKKGKRRE